MKSLKNVAQLDAYLQNSQNQPVMFFKHSPRCGVSHYARAELEKALKAVSHPIPVCEVDVLAARPVSNMLAEKSGVTHESPQVLLMRGEECVWHGSHGDLRATVLQEKMDST